MELILIKETVQQAAEAITAALEIETEIVDANLRIIGGTGRYLAKVNSYEEEGDLYSSFLYACLLRTCSDYICLDPSSDAAYDPKENELAEICCPIVLDHKAVGLIGLIAFTEGQRKKISSKQDTLLSFLHIMAELIASRLLTQLNTNSLQQLLDSALDMSAASGNFDSIMGDSSPEQSTHPAHDQKSPLFPLTAALSRKCSWRASYLATKKALLPALIKTVRLESLNWQTAVRSSWMKSETCRCICK